MTAVVGTRLDDCGGQSVDVSVRDVCSMFRRTFARTDTVVVVPDAFYPYHESTGLVTNLDVVEAVSTEIAAQVDDVLVLPAVGNPTATGTVLDLLGYDTLGEPSNVTVRPLPACQTVQRRLRLPGGHTAPKTVEVDLPRVLVDSPVVTVPTLRNSPGDVLAGSMRTLELLVDQPGTTPDQRWRSAAAITDLVDPDLSVLDGTYVYAGRPHRGRFVAAGSDPVAVDALGAFLLEAGRRDVPELREHGWEGGYKYVDGFSSDALRQQLPNEDPPTPDEEGLMEKGYRLYARLSGDVLPPQVLPEGSV